MLDVLVVRHSAADREGLFSLEWLERWRAILISLTIFPASADNCSHNDHCEHSFQSSRVLWLSCKAPGWQSPLAWELPQSSAGGSGLVASGRGSQRRNGTIEVELFAPEIYSEFACSTSVN
jgi:hypothetical protein